METGAVGCRLSTGRQARISRVFISMAICLSFVGMGWYQPNLADAETLIAGPTTPIASADQNINAAYVVMSRITVTSSSGGDNLVTLSSVTIVNPGTANVAAARVYISSTPTTTLPADAVRIGRTLGVFTAGSTTLISLNTGTVSDRAVISGTPKYLYILFDMMAAGTVRASVTGIGVLTPDTGTGVISAQSNLVTVLSTGTKATVVSCFDCHGDAVALNSNTMDGPRSAATGSFLGSHNKHAGSMSYGCAVCHINPASMAHRNSFINMSTPLQYGGNYSKTMATTSFPQVSSPVLGNCSSVYCHSNGVGTFATATWGGAPMNTQCTGCHGGNSAATPVMGGAHASHINSVGRVGRLLPCADCHNATVSSTSDRVVTTPANHVNALTNIKFDNGANINRNADNPTYNGVTTTVANGAAVAPGTNGNCSSVYCHSSGNLTAANGTIVVSGATPTFKTINWSTGSIGCSGCHGDGAGRAHPTYTGTTGGSTTANSHVKHVESSGIGCAFCHTATVGTNTTTTPVSMPANTWHLNRTENVVFLSNGSATGVYNPAVGNKTCSSNYCHGVTNTSPSWGGTTTCISCHQATNSVTGLSARHIEHYNSANPPTSMTSPSAHTASSYVYGCSDCHPTATHSQGPAVLNLQDAQVGGARISTYTAGTTSAVDSQGFKYTNLGSCTTNCHTRDGLTSSPVKTPVWTGTATPGACNVCHRAGGENYSTMTTTATRLSMTHAIHIANDRYGLQTANFTCEVCHTSVAANNTSLQTTTTARNLHVNTLKDVAFGSFATATAGWNGTSCSNTYCHSPGTAFVGTHASITWAGAAPTNCGSCHGSAATIATGAHAAHLATSTPNGPMTCRSCHNATASTNVSISSYTNHVNKLVTINFDSTSSGATATYNGQTAGGATVYQKTPGTTLAGTCNTTYCHGGNSQSWNATNPGVSVCVKCHGVPGATVAQYAANTDLAAPGYVSLSAPTGTGVNTSGSFGVISGGVSNDPRVGAHDAHNRGYGGYKPGGVACTECHAVNALNSPGHMNGTTTMVWGALTSSGVTPSYNPVTGNCSTNYCHGGAFGAGVIGTGPTVSWTNGAYLANPASAMNATDCSKCHLSPPTSTLKYDHAGITVAAGNCVGCHEHDGAGVSHIDGTLYGAGTCDTCHSYDLDATGDWGKRPYAVEGWGAHAVHISHLKTLSGATLSAATNTFGGAAYNMVCGVCHTTQTANHSMGNSVNLRSINFGDNSSLYSFASGTPIYSGTTGSTSLQRAKTCSNVSCHFQATPVWQGY